MRHNGFVNLQQYYLEAFLVEALQREPLAELRWLNRVDAIDSPADGGPVTLRVHARGRLPHAGRMGDRLRRCQQPAAPGAGPAARGVRPQRDRWIIIDVVLRGTSWPEERWTWLDAGSNHGRAVWRHKMADDTWRLDFQLRPDEDAQAACTPQAMRQRVWDLLGEQVDFDIAWHGVWAYRHECLPGLRHGRVLFAGDSAHLVAPFGARRQRRHPGRRQPGLETGAGAAGRASDTLLDSYSAERKHAALENIRQARRSSRFVHPGPAESARMWRDAIIALAPRHDVPARMINTGRLCMPAIYPPSPLAHPASPHAGRALPNVVLDRRAQLTAPAARPLVHRPGLRRPRTGHPEPAADDALLRRVTVGAHCDAEGREALRRQLGVEMNGEVWLIRPDQHVMAAVDAAASGQAGAALPDWIAAALYPAPTRVPGRALIECRSPRPCPCRSRSLTICSNV